MKESVILLGNAQSSVGIVTDPEVTEPANDYGIILLNAGRLHRVGPNRMSVRLARRLAELGFVVLRLDFSGIGDSLVRQDSLTRKAAILAEAHDAIEFLRVSRGVHKFIFVGLCWGAACSFEIAIQEPSVVGVFLMDGYAYRTPRFYITLFKHLLNVRKCWNFVTGQSASGRRFRRMFGVSSLNRSGVPNQQRYQRSFPPLEQVRNDLKSLVERGVHLYFVYTEGGMQDRYNYPNQFWGFFPSVRRSKNVRVKFMRKTDHTFTLIKQQNQLIKMVEYWATSITERITPLEKSEVMKWLG